MNPWYKLDVGDVTQAAERLKSTQKAFMGPFIAAPAGSGRALFWRENNTTRVVEIFFSPQSSDVALSLGAVPCEKPIIGNGHIRLLVGDHNLRDYFPGQEQQ